MEEAQEDQQTHMIKGKRTKRQRLLSSNVSPAGSLADHFFDSTEEDQDMANCVILLAQCQSRESPKRAHYDQEETGQIQIIHNSNMKFNSRRFLESPDMGTGKGGGGGYYVYECKTCNRTFPSFQALGGHRASHKKPKATTNYEFETSLHKQQKFIFSNLDEEDAHLRNLSSLSNNNNNNNNRGGSNFYCGSNKVHECSICNAEFTSGQALGGHMRRHRSAATTTNTTLSLTPMAVEVEEPIKSRNNVLSLDLDLNLPAPEDDTRELKLPLSSQQQQQKSSPVFSAVPTLVDCHY